METSRFKLVDSVIMVTDTTFGVAQTCISKYKVLKKEIEQVFDRSHVSDHDLPLGYMYGVGRV